VGAGITAGERRETESREEMIPNPQDADSLAVD